MDLSLKQATTHLARLVSLGSFLKGNAVTMKRVCGNKNCMCITKGEKHISIYLAKKLEEEVSAKVKAYHRIKELVDKISELNYGYLELKKKNNA